MASKFEGTQPALPHLPLSPPVSRNLAPSLLKLPRGKPAQISPSRRRGTLKGVLSHFKVT